MGPPGCPGAGPGPPGGSAAAVSGPERRKGTRENERGNERALGQTKQTGKQQRVPFCLPLLALHGSQRRFCLSGRVAGNVVLNFKTRMFSGFWKAWLNKIENKMHVCIDFNLCKQLVFGRKVKAE